MTNRIGIGYDAHPLVQGRALVVGGVEIPHPKGLSGHSDGDVLAHAVMDALLGAAGLGDKGTHFPSSDPRYEGASSIGLLADVASLLAGARWRVVNVDATILAQNPRLAPFIDAMKQNIGDAISVPVGNVSVKATTTDHLGFVGREEGMSAYAVALLEDVP